MSTGSKLRLKASDGVEFLVDPSVMQYSLLWTDQIDFTRKDGFEEETIPVPNVSSTILGKVIEYCTYHTHFKKKKSTEDEIKRRDAEFVQVDHRTPVDLINAANYLNMANLLDLMCTRAANWIEGKSVRQIRNTFGLVNDFTFEEELNMWKEWGFDWGLLPY